MQEARNIKAKAEKAQTRKKAETEREERYWVAQKAYDASRPSNYYDYDGY